jgi:hypothetical protein
VVASGQDLEEFLGEERFVDRVDGAYSGEWL